jgi:aminoglycoside 3-N-acetyltransferase
LDKERLVSDLVALGIRPGDAVMVHSSFKALGVPDPETVVLALLEAVGTHGILMMPGLSYMQQPPTVHSTNDTPSCVGFLPEYFRKRPGTVRSIHPTHSVCATGPRVKEWLEAHAEDTTPCGPHSPFRLVMERKGKILMLGCGLKPNTAMHAVEEFVRPSYLFRAPVTYTITPPDGRTFTKTYTPHHFKGYIQRYDRVAGVLDGQALITGPVGAAPAQLIDANALLVKARERLEREPFYFVDREGKP